MYIDAFTEILKLKAKRFHIKSQRFTEVIETPHADEWISKLI